MKDIILKRPTDESEYIYNLANELVKSNFNIDKIKSAFDQLEERKKYVLNNIKKIVETNKLLEYESEIIAQLFLFSNEDLNLILFARECPLSIIYEISKIAEKNFGREKLSKIFCRLSEKKRNEFFMLMLMKNFKL